MDSYIIEANRKKSRIPAMLDFAQSGTGLLLRLFIWVHILLEGSIILGKDSYYFVAKTMELAFLSDTGEGYPIVVFFAVSIVFLFIVIHALLCLRKFPASWKQHRIMIDQVRMMNHTDTNLWYAQVVTGFILFFAASVHLYVMLTNPGNIGPYMSADRIVSGNMWPLYIILLICVEVHGTIGFYRLCMKWGWFSGKDPRKARETLKKFRNGIGILFLSIGFLALFVFGFIGITHMDKAGERYHKVVEKIHKQEKVHDQKPAEDSEPEEDSRHVEEKHSQPAEGSEHVQGGHSQPEEDSKHVEEEH